jgi:hypothetical protein
LARAGNGLFPGIIRRRSATTLRNYGDVQLSNVGWRKPQSTAAQGRRSFVRVVRGSAGCPVKVVLMEERQ